MRSAVYPAGVPPQRLASFLVVVAACSGEAPPWAGQARAGRDPLSPLDEGTAAVPASCVRDVGQVQAVTGPGAPAEPRRPTHTFSIVARDAATGDLGVAVQSHWFAVGAAVTWAEPGVGAIATQSFAEPAYGRKGLARLRAGGAAPEVLAALVAEDGRPDVRQVGMVDAAGRVAAHTGAACMAHAGHLVGDGFAVQANLMASDRVVPAMAAAYRAADGDLAERLLATLDAAQAAGGDVRGCQSAALLVVKGQASSEPSHDVVVDLRVDDAAAPLVELRRLLAVHRVYAHMNAGDAAVEAHDLPRAAAEYGAAAAAAPGRDEVRYWQAVTLATTGDLAGALPILRALHAADPRWREVTRRLQPAVVPAGPEGDALLARMLGGR